MWESRVDLNRLTDLLERISRWDLRADVLRVTQGDGCIRSEDRDEVVCLLARSPNILLREISECFLDINSSKPLTSQRISQIIEKAGGRVVVKGPRVPIERRVKFLTSRQGCNEALKIMRKVAREGRFWSERRLSDGRIVRGRLSIGEVLRALGLPKAHPSLYREAWGRLIQAGIISETDLVGIVLRYGLGEEDPVAYLQRLYHEDATTTIERVAQVINRRAKPLGLHEVSPRSLLVYMKECGIPIKTRGSKDPFWLRKT